jgi:hypothetical protein
MLLKRFAAWISPFTLADLILIPLCLVILLKG